MVTGSVIVVSRHRPAALARCITALRQQDFNVLEVIIVADPAACMGLAAQSDLKIIPFDVANISAARNLGLAQAAGDVTLFIDDDAVPEPNWARRLIAALDAPQVVAATGFVRGRNGISYQWQAGEVDALAADHTLTVPQTPSLHQGTPLRAVKTQGTNCAFRTQVLRSIGGFDPAFAFYLDEADVNLRLAPLGPTAVVPLAQVHHGYLASARRKSNRAPTDLFDIGASTAAFLRKHAPSADMAAAWQRLHDQQSARLSANIRARRLARGQVAGLMDGLWRGWQAGADRPLHRAGTIAAAHDFRPLQGLGPRDHIEISGYCWKARALHHSAVQAVAAGHIVTVFCFSPSPRRQTLQFLPQGYWWQSGGIWGRSDRDIPADFTIGLATRAAREADRIAPFRQRP